MAERRSRDEALAAPTPAMGRRHVGLGPGLVDEDQPARIQFRTLCQPVRAPRLYVGTVQLGGRQRLFLRVMPSRLKNLRMEL